MLFTIKDHPDLIRLAALNFAAKHPKDRHRIVQEKSAVVAAGGAHYVVLKDINADDIAILRLDIGYNWRSRPLNVLEEFSEVVKRRWWRIPSPQVVPESVLKTLADVGIADAPHIIKAFRDQAKGHVKDAVDDLRHLKAIHQALAVAAEMAARLVEAELAVRKAEAQALAASFEGVQ